MINLKVRFKNPLFMLQLSAAFFIPILGYMGLTIEDLTTWEIVFDAVLAAINNPYVLLMVVISVFNAFTDPTTTGITDSSRALKYEKPQ